MAGKKDGWHPAENSEYDVGYRKPPRATQFKKGKSGNPNGRPKRKPTLEQMVEKLFSQHIPIVIDGKQQRIRRDEALLMSALTRAIKGDSRLIKFMTDIMSRRPAEEPPNNFVSIRLVKPEDK